MEIVRTSFIQAPDRLGGFIEPSVGMRRGRGGRLKSVMFQRRMQPKLRQ